MILSPYAYFSGLLCSWEIPFISSFPLPLWERDKRVRDKRVRGLKAES
jgi:hypothetical protein